MNIQKYIEMLEQHNIKGLIISKIYEVSEIDYDVLCLGLIDNEKKEHYFISMKADNPYMDIKKIDMNYRLSKNKLRKIEKKGFIVHYNSRFD